MSDICEQGELSNVDRAVGHGPSGDRPARIGMTRDQATRTSLQKMGSRATKPRCVPL